jgi:Tfp pilus assembly protein PilF
VQDDADKQFLQCIQFSDRGEFDQARDCYQKVLQINPLHAKTHNNLGIIYHRNGNLEEATEALKRATTIDPSLTEAYVNLGNLMQDKHDLESALKYYDAALRLDPKLAHARYSRATTLLAMGRFEEGWQEYEWRWQLPDALFVSRDFTRPRWDGNQNIDRKRVLLFAEQGFGDTLQFIRYASMVAARGAHVIIECRPELRSLLQTAEGIHSVAQLGQPLPEFDYEIPIMSLPLTFKTRLETIPAKVPYLFPDELAINSWRSRLYPNVYKLKIGLVWAGDPGFVRAREKSCPLEGLTGLFDVPGCSFFSLQMGAAKKHVAALNDTRQVITDYTSDLKNFSDTAAFIAALDLVITIDTAVAHLAGALAKPVWVMLPFSPDWRWLMKGEHTPWYPTMRLFRQLSVGNWDHVIEQVRQALVGRCSPLDRP